ncbi:MAG: hypothetical protein ABJA50_07100 [Chloroflexota bacterium]
MRYRALILAASALLCLVIAGCNSTGLPGPVTSNPTPTPQSTATAVALAFDTPTANPFFGATRTATPKARATQVEPTARATGTAVSNATPVPNGTVEAQNLATLAEIERQDALFRGLKPLADVPAQFISSDQLRENLTKEMEQYYSKDDAKNDATELWLMRLIDKRDIDLYQLQIDLQSEQVLGYYDQKVKEFFVRSDGTKLSPTAKETLAHEYVHALQDQHYDLQKLLPDQTTDDDKSTAIRSLVEGDATVSGILFAQSHFSPAEYQSIIDDSTNSDTTVLDSAPKYISDSLYFPYNDGVQFVIALGITNSFDPVNKALADPPVSSEQIMHPEKYTAANRDMPKIVAAPPLTDTLGAGWSHINNGTLGEFDLKELLTFNNATDPAGAAAGWGGGTYNLYTNADNALSMINTTWDTTKDATEFENALKETFAKDTIDGNVIVGSDGLRFYEVKRTNDDISILSSTDRATLEKAITAVK